MTKRSSEKFYTKKYYTDYSFGFTATNRHDHKRIIDIVKQYNPKRVIDIGCGLGTLLELLPLPKKSKFGLESNEYAVNECKKRGLNVILHRNIRKLPLTDGTFDMVILNEVLEHLDSPSEILKEIRRILKVKGLVVITTPSKSLLVRNIDKTHISELSYRELETVVSNAGFKIAKHEVSGFHLWDFIGRKIVFPLGKVLVKLAFLKKSVGGVRYTVDHSKMSHFRTTFVHFGAQQLLLAKKKST